jgi:hypothetical protein
MNEIKPAPRGIRVVVMGDIFSLEHLPVTMFGQHRMELIQVVSVNEEVQIHGGTHHAKDSHGESADRRIANPVALERRQQGPENTFKVHAIILCLRARACNLSFTFDQTTLPFGDINHAKLPPPVREPNFRRKVFQNRSGNPYPIDHGEPLS